MLVQELLENVIPVDFKDKKRGKPPKEEYYAEKIGNSWKVFRGDKGIWVTNAKDEEQARQMARNYNSGVIKEPETIPLHKVFGSHQYGILHDAGIKFIEKPSYWEDMDHERVTSHEQLAKAEKELAKHGYKLKTYTSKELWGYDPKGPLKSPIEMPKEDTFIVKMENGKRYLVDRTGAQTYFRMWSKIKD
jgi:hypothetical protein